MTAKALMVKSKSNYTGIYSALCLFLSFIMIALSKEIKQGVYNGLIFSFTTIIPTLFPFYILSDLWSAWFRVKKDSALSKIFEKIFNISSCGLTAMISGIVCGFPIGVKAASQLYIKNEITYDEFERLSGFVNNPSASFIISGVGAGMLCDTRAGFLLYFSVIFSSALVGIVFRNNKRKPKNTDVNIRQSFDLVDSIKNAATTSISVASYIIFFSGLISVVNSAVPSEALRSVISSFLEVSNATKLIVLCPDFNLPMKLGLIGFSLGFSGLSVHMQAMSFFGGSPFPRKYFLMKLLQGVLSALLSFTLAGFLI